MTEDEKEKKDDDGCQGCPNRGKKDSCPDSGKKDDCDKDDCDKDCDDD